MAADALAMYYDLTFRAPRDNALRWLNDLTDSFGEEAVSEALAVEWALSQDLRTFLSRTSGRLQAKSAEAERKRAVAERDREAERIREFETMPLEQRQANLARLAAMVKEATKPWPR